MIKENEHPRVVAYYQLQAGIEITLRMDICSDLDFMILDVRCSGLRHPPTHLINIYNQMELGELQESVYTTDRLASVHLHPATPTIITGDWNLHHTLWNSRIDTSSISVRMQEVVNWLEGQGFNLCSKKDIHTRSSSGTQWDTIINLTFTFANEATIGQGIIQNHQVDPDLALLLDHHALTFTIRDPREMVDNLSEAKYNWKHAKEEDFVEALDQELHKDNDLFDSLIQQVLNRNCLHATPNELDSAVRFINDCMKCATEKSVPTCRMCSCSKPWWNEDLTKAFKAMRMARDMMRTYFQHFNCQSELMVAEVKLLCKNALSLVKIAKHEYYLKLTEDANPQNMWSFCKWTSGRCMYTSPTLLRGDGTEPMVTHHDKCNLLRTTLFPPQPKLTDEPPLDLQPRVNDMVYQEVTKQEVHNALFMAALMNAPGLSGMMGKSYCWMWTILEEEMFHLI